MKTHFRNAVAAMLAAMLVGAVALGGSVAFAGEGGQHSAQRAKLKAEWAEARARDAARPDASFVERLFPTGSRDSRLADAQGADQPKKN